MLFSSPIFLQSCDFENNSFQNMYFAAVILIHLNAWRKMNHQFSLE